MARPSNRSASGGVDWVAWHADYDSDTPLRRRLELVQRHIGKFLDSFDGSPVRVVSMCAGEARDLLGAVARVDRRDVVGRLVELDPSLATKARREAADLGLDGLEVVVADAGQSAVYRGAVPADLVLECGVFGNISDEDIERTVGATPGLCAPGAWVLWTRHRGEPDQTPAIRAWYRAAGFEEIAFDPVPDAPGSVGVMRYAGQARPLVDRRLFTFNRAR